MDVGCEEWGWNLIDGATMHEIRERLAGYEGMTFRDIIRAGSHEVEVYRLCSEAQKRLKEIPLALDALMSLRISGKGRLWGVRTGHVIDLLWWDPAHQVCPSLKKHT